MDFFELQARSARCGRNPGNLHLHFGILIQKRKKKKSTKNFRKISVFGANFK
jgi:hypothetical protein